MLAGMSALAIVGRVLPAWLGWVGGLLAIGLLVPGGSPAGPVGALWLLVAGLLLHRRSGAGASRMAAGAADAVGT
jgi:hypothetical protein